MYEEDLSLRGTERADTFTDLLICALGIAPGCQKPMVKEIGKAFVLSRLEDTPSLQVIAFQIVGLLQPPLFAYFWTSFIESLK